MYLFIEIPYVDSYETKNYKGYTLKIRGKKHFLSKIITKRVSTCTLFSFIL